MRFDYGRSYRLSTVAHAADLPKATLSSWLHRGHIDLAKTDRDTSGSGDHRLFSWHRVINIAIVAELNRLGIPPSAGSSRAALKFSDLGGSKRAHWVGDPPSDVRPAGELYPHGMTYLVIRNSSGELDAKVTDNLDRLFEQRAGADDVAVIVIDMHRLVYRVRARLAEADDVNQHDGD